MNLIFAPIVAIAQCAFPDNSQRSNVSVFWSSSYI